MTAVHDVVPPAGDPGGGATEDDELGQPVWERSVGRRRFLGYLVAAPTLTIAVRVGLDAAAPAEAAAAPSLPDPSDLLDLGDVLIVAGLLTSSLLRLTVNADGSIVLEMPRQEVGQGMTTSCALMVAEEMDARLTDVQVPLSQARPELLFNQLTGGSNATRSLYQPVRNAAAFARAQLVTAAGRRLGVPANTLTTANSVVSAPDGRTATYASLAVAAGKIRRPSVSTAPKDPADFTVIGTPTTRIDARDLVTGKAQYALDLAIPNAKPTMVRRPPTVNGTVVSYSDTAARAMPGVIAITQIPTGVAVMAETFGQAEKARDALVVTWGPGPVANLSDRDITNQLNRALLPLTPPPLLAPVVNASFDFAFISHAPMETLSAVADVRADRAEIWAACKSPIIASQEIAAAVNLPQSAVTFNVVRAGGSFGRRLFYDAPIEAAQISKKLGRPVKLMWSRGDDMQHGRMRSASRHKLRAVLSPLSVLPLLRGVLTYEHRVATVQTDFSHGLGEAITAGGFALLPGPISQSVYVLTINNPYNQGVTTSLLSEITPEFNTASWRSVYSALVRTADEVMTDRIAKKLGRDPMDYRRNNVQGQRGRAVLDKLRTLSNWGRAMPNGMAQGMAFHEEYRSVTGCVVEIDARDRQNARVTKATVVCDPGLAINPRGLEAQLLGGLTDGISLILTAGLHVDNGTIREKSFTDFKYARQRNSPPSVQIHIMPPTGEPGGGGELGDAQLHLHPQRLVGHRRRARRPAAALGAARQARGHRAEVRLRGRRLPGLHQPPRRRGDPAVRHERLDRGRPRGHHDRGAGRRRHPAPGPAGLGRHGRGPVRLLPARADHDGGRPAAAYAEPHRRRHRRHRERLPVRHLLPGAAGDQAGRRRALGAGPGPR